MRTLDNSGIQIGGFYACGESGVRKIDNNLDEIQKEMANLRSYVHKLWIALVAAQVAALVVAIYLLMEYSRVISYYQSTADTNQEILLNQKYVNSELEDIFSTLQSLQID